MIDEFKKSLNSTLYERVTSPLYGALIASWIVWNWKILYLTFFVSPDEIESNKLDYISNNLLDINNLIYLPLFSTVVILTVIPYIGNAAYWVSLHFKKWRVDKRNSIEEKRLLTLEQSNGIRMMSLPNL